jgi:hypothetical protein
VRKKSSKDNPNVNQIQRPQCQNLCLAEEKSKGNSQKAKGKSLDGQLNFGFDLNFGF